MICTHIDSAVCCSQNSVSLNRCVDQVEIQCFYCQSNSFLKTAVGFWKLICYFFQNSLIQKRNVFAPMYLIIEYRYSKMSIWNPYLDSSHIDLQNVGRNYEDVLKVLLYWLQLLLVTGPLFKSIHDLSNNQNNKQAFYTPLDEL